jgi:5-methylcytosine-specific restriction enzyme A
MSRQEFTAKTRVAAFLRAEGRCEDCSAQLSVGNTEYDHAIPCELGGDNDLRNCVVLCRSCHRAKTSRDDIPRIAKAKRNLRSTANIRKPRSITRWRRMDGTPVFATRER